MVDILVAGALVAAGVTVVTRRFTPDVMSRPVSRTMLAVDSDLPCPWCHAATREDDSRCPSCRQPFG